jgi:hypothetical protein
MGGTGIEPDIKRVAHLAVLVGFHAQQFLGIQREPALDPRLLNALRNRFDQFRRTRMQRTGFLVQKERDRHAPVALAGDAPVRTGLHHAFEPRTAPRGEELRLVDGTLGHPAQRRAFLVRGVLLALVFHADEPLRRRTENDRRLVAPAVRVAMANLLALEQQALGFEFLQHQRVGIPHALAGQFADGECRRIAEELSIVANRVVHRQAIALANHVVVHTMRRCGMHLAGTCLGRNMRAADNGHIARLERMAQQDLVKRRALARADHRAFKLVAFEAALGQLARQDQRPLGGLDQVVVEFRMHAHCLVGRQRPRRRRPDHGKGRATQVREAESLGQLLGVVLMHREGDVNGGRGLVLVLDFGLSQRRAAIKTPVNRLQALIQIALLKDLADRANLVGFGLESHRQVGVVPFAKHAQANEVLLLTLNLLTGEGTAEFAHLVARDVLAVQLLDLVFDRQAVAIPARYVGRIETGQCARADNDVLEDLVHRMADVDIAVGVGRAVVQHEAGPALGCLADLLVELFLLPLGHPLRLALGKVAAHREGCIGKIQSAFVVSHSKTNHHRGTETQRNTRDFLCASVSLWLRNRFFHSRRHAQSAP